MKQTNYIIKIGAIITFAITTAYSAAQPTQEQVVASSFAKNKIKPYSLKICIVSGEELGSMVDYIRFVYKDQEVKVCCKPCVKKFKRSPQKYLKLLEEANNKRKK